MGWRNKTGGTRSEVSDGILPTGLEISAQGTDECMLNVHLLLLTWGGGGHWAGGTKLEAHGRRYDLRNKKRKR